MLFETFNATACFDVLIESPCLDCDSTIDEEVRRHVSVGLVYYIREAPSAEMIKYESFGAIHAT